MKTVEMDVMARDFASYLRKVADGETFLIASQQRPVAELRPAGKGDSNARPFGLSAGEFIVPDDFDAPVPTDIIADFDPK
jgi:antitoxin (DNA-binding transcriptional repressor) of toxin-antitoxin stability system